MLTIITRRHLQQFREIREALQELADACALTLPGSAWTNEIDDALVRATELVGPMGESQALVAAAERREEREFQAWSDGYHLGEEETDEALADKDAFIEKQAGLIQELIQCDGIQWDKVPDGLRHDLADYV